LQGTTQLSASTPEGKSGVLQRKLCSSIKSGQRVKEESTMRNIPAVLRRNMSLETAQLLKAKFVKRQLKGK